MIRDKAAHMDTVWKIGDRRTGAGSGCWRCCGCRPESRQRRRCALGHNTGCREAFGMWVTMVMSAGSLVFVAPCGFAAGVGLPAAVAPRLSARRLVGGHRARRGDSRGVSGGRTARAGRDRRLCGGAQPAGVDSMLVAETAGMTFRQRRASGTAYGRSMAVSSEIRRTSMSGSQSENGRNLLAVNPNDNQGYRFPLMDSLVQSTEWKKVLSHAAKARRWRRMDARSRAPGSDRATKP